MRQAVDSRQTGGFLTDYLVPTLRLILVTAGYLLIIPLLILQAAAALAHLLPAPTFPGWLRWPGLLLAMAGAYLFLRSWLVLGAMGKEWPRRRPVRLVTDHIFMLVRHPLYLGYSLFWLGYGLWRTSPAIPAVAAVLTAGWLGYVLTVEEPRLLARYGRKYAEYRQTTPLLLPHWRTLARGALSLNIFTLLTLIVFRWLFRLLWRIRVEGQEHVPDEGGFFLIVNHVNLADPFMVGLFLTRQVYFMASDELFRKPLFRLLFGSLWPAFPKRRWGRDIGALRNVERMLARGEAVGIFPEGARNWDGGPVSVGDETYRFIHHCGAPVLTATIIGGHEAMPRWAHWPSFTEVTIRFFPLIKPVDVASAKELRALIEPRIFACALEKPRARKIWRSHRRLPIVTWGCLKCGTARAIVATKEGFRCRECGAAWRVTPALELVDLESGEMMLEREYHAELKERLAAGEIRGGLTAWSKAEGFRVVDGRLQPLGRGELVIDRQTLSFDNGQTLYRLAVPEIRYAFLNLRNRLVVSDGLEALEIKIVDESPVRIEDYLGAARSKPLRMWRPGMAEEQILG